jgi:hypothetical protein
MQTHARLFLLAQGSVGPRQLIVDGSIVIGGYRDLEVFFGLAIVAQFGVCNREGFGQFLAQ